MIATESPLLGRSPTGIEGLKFRDDSLIGKKPWRGLSRIPAAVTPADFGWGESNAAVSRECSRSKAHISGG